MDSLALARFVAAWLFALAWLLPVPAQATVTVTEYCTSSAQSATCGATLGWFSSMSAACSAAMSNSAAANPAGGQRFVSDDPQCSFCQSGGGSFAHYCTTATGTPPTLPPANMNLPYGTRQVTQECAAGTVEVNGQCVDRCQPKANTAPNDLLCSGSRCSWYQAATPASPLTVCLPDSGAQPGKGCLVTGTREISWFDSSLNMWATRSYDNKFTGSTCTISASVPGVGTVTSSTGTGTSTVPETPPPGKCYGTVNGSTVLVDCDITSIPSVPGSSTVTTTSPDGTTTTGTQDGGTTTCSNGVCTTVSSKTVTVTVTTPGGSTTQSTTVQNGTSIQSKSKYCEDHPSAASCKDEESTFSGSCVSGTFTCTGDAAICAAAKAVNEQKCLMTAKSEVTAQVEAMANGTYAPMPTTVTKTLGQFDQSSAFSTGCPSDQTVTVAGMSIVIPLASVCPQLQVMGNVLVAFSLLVGTIFVLRGLGSS